MYSGLKVVNSTVDEEDAYSVIHHYQVVDPILPINSCYFSAPMTRSKIDSTWNHTEHTNNMLYGVYYIYKFSKYSACSNIRRMIYYTFPTNLRMIKETPFYREHKSLIDNCSRTIIC